MESAVNVSVDKGCLRLIGEIPVASSREDLEAGQQHLLLIGKDLRQYVLAESGFEHLFSDSEPLAS